jgi:hypothetical protein
VVAAAALVGACASEPGYAPPTETEARGAYVRALRADWVDSPPPQRPSQPTAIGPGDAPADAAGKAARALAYESAVESRAIARSQLSSLASLRLGACNWSDIDAGEVKPVAGARLAGVVEGYRCAYRVVHDSAQRGRVGAEGTGYFFQRAGTYDFAEIDQAAFEPVGR